MLRNNSFTGVASAATTWPAFLRAQPSCEEHAGRRVVLHAPNSQESLSPTRRVRAWIVVAMFGKLFDSAGSGGMLFPEQEVDRGYDDSAAHGGRGSRAE